LRVFWRESGRGEDTQRKKEEGYVIGLRAASVVVRWFTQEMDKGKNESDEFEKTKKKRGRGNAELGRGG